MNAFLAARLLALRAVAHPDSDPEFGLRHLFREYSKRFNTPLDRVADLPLYFVLQNYFEDLYSELDEREVDEKDTDQRPWLSRERDRLIETDEERIARLAAEAEDEEIGDLFLRQVEAEEAKKARKWVADAKAGKAVPKFTLVEDAGDAVMRAAAQEMRKVAAETRKFAREVRGAAPERLDMSKQPKTRPTLPPDVNMRFEIDDED